MCQAVWSTMGSYLASPPIWWHASSRIPHPPSHKEIGDVSSSDRLNLQPIELQMRIRSLIPVSRIANEALSLFHSCALAAASVQPKSARCPQ